MHWTITIREVMPGFGAVPFFGMEDAVGLRIEGTWKRNTDGTLTSAVFEATEGQAHQLTEFSGFVRLVRTDMESV